MKEIKKTLTIGGNDLKLYMETSIDGKTIEKRESKSLVGNFLKILAAKMGMDYRDTNIYVNRRLSSIVNISSVTNNGSGFCRVANSSNISLNTVGTNYKIAIGGVIGTTEANGVHDYVKISTYVFDLPGVPFVNAYVSGGAYREMKWTYILRDPDSFYAPNICVGASTTPETMNDIALINTITSGSGAGALTYNGNIVSQDTSDAFGSEITITRSFTNNSGATITVNEIGLLDYPSAANGTVGYDVLIARDIIALTNVDSGKTLTVNYKIKTTLATIGDKGGFINGFIKTLYKQFTHVTRAILDINNVSRENAQNQCAFMTLASGGKGETWYGNYWDNYQLGVVLGTSVVDPSMNDYYLGAEIPQGPTGFEYSGGFVQNFVQTSTDASFDIVKLAQNVSGGSITVGEIGLTSMLSDTSTGGESYLNGDYAVMLAHNTLATPVVVADGEVVKTTYTIKLTI